MGANRPHLFFRDLYVFETQPMLKYSHLLHGDFSLKSLAVLCFICVLGLVFIVYAPGFTGDFAFDDGPSILYNTHIAIRHLDINSLLDAAFSGTSGPLKRPVSMVSFALNHYFWGFSPYSFKLTNFGIHALNGVALLALTVLLLKAYKIRFQPLLNESHIWWLSVAVAAAWLLHPLNLTAVLYVVQRMTSLSAFFTLLSLICYARGRLILDDGARRGILHILLAYLLFLPLAVLSKENGALLPLLMFVLELTLFQFETRTVCARRFLQSLHTIFVALPTIGLLGYLIMHPVYLDGGYQMRDFSLSERVLTETRVLWTYLGMIVLPRIGSMGLFHDDIPLSHGLLDPITTLFSALGLLVMLIVAIFQQKRYPMLSLGVLLFLVGHSLESSVIPLEIAFEHRNYLPMYGILLPTIYVALYPFSHVKSLMFRRVGIVILIGLFAVGTMIRADHWSNSFLLSLTEVEHHPNSFRANSEMGAMYGNFALRDKGNSEQYLSLSKGYFETSASLRKNSTDGLFGLVYYSARLGKTVEREWIDDLQKRLETPPFSGNSAVKMYFLAACQVERNCKFSKTDLMQLLDAALRNPTLSGQNKAIVLSTLSYHLINYENDHAGAVRASFQAVEAVPQEPEYRRNLIDLLIRIGRLDEARKQLDIAKKLTHFSTFSEQEESLRNASKK